MGGGWSRTYRYAWTVVLHCKRDGRATASCVTSYDGGGGTRTPKGLRPPHFECGALPIRLRLRTKPGRSVWGRKPLHLLSKSGRPDLNRGPLRPERSALPD